MGSPRSPFLLKGALIELTSPFLVPVPHVVMFQYNPETVSRSLTPFRAPARETGQAEAKQVVEERNARVQPFDPQETISLTLVLDASDDLETTDAVAVAVGIADRLAALERLLYPVGGDVGLLAAGVDVSLKGTQAQFAAEVVHRETPIILFVWGPGRIVPVRVKDLSVSEKTFNPLLYPIRAEVQLGLQVLTPIDFEGTLSFAAEIAKVAYRFTRTQQDLLAFENILNTRRSILSL